MTEDSKKESIRELFAFWRKINKISDAAHQMQKTEKKRSNYDKLIADGWYSIHGSTVDFTVLEHKDFLNIQIGFVKLNDRAEVITNRSAQLVTNFKTGDYNEIVTTIDKLIGEDKNCKEELTLEEKLVAAGYQKVSFVDKNDIGYRIDIWNNDLCSCSKLMKLDTTVEQIMETVEKMKDL